MPILKISVTVTTLLKEILYDLLQDEEIKDFDINSFDSGRETLDYIREHENFHLMFTAVQTDELDGVELVELVLQDMPEKAKYIFIITSSNNNEQVQELKSVGAKKFIRKPIKLDNFKHMIMPEIKRCIREMH